MNIDLNHLEKLSNLSFTPQEKSLYEVQLPETIDYVKNLSQIDTSHISKYKRVCPNKNVAFNDGQENNFKIKPQIYKVKRIV